MENQFNNSVNNCNIGASPVSSWEAPGMNYFAQYDPKFREKWLERNELRRRTRICVIPMLILILAFSFLSSLVINLLLSFGVSRSEISAFFGDPAISSVYSVVVACIFFGIPFALSARLSGFRISELIPLGAPKRGVWLPMLLIGISFCGFANIMAGMADNFFSGLGFEYSLPDSDAPRGMLGFLITFLSTAVEPALMEEFAMRGITLGLFRRWGDGFAIIVSAVLFGLMHGNFSQIPFAFLVGLILGFIRVKTNSLWIACAVHAINNFIAVIFEYIPASDAVNLWYGVYLMLCMLLGIIGLLLMSKRGTAIELEKSNSVLPMSKCYKAAFTHPLTVIFSVICLLEAIIYWEPIANILF